MSNKEQGDLTRLEAATNPALQRLPEGVVTDAARIGNIARINALVPPRQVDLGNADPFGLLEHQDTYERMAGHLFDECEGLYRLLASGRPEIGKQVRLASKGRQDSITLPQAELMGIYKYELVRTEDSASVQYLFHRADKSYEDKGFRIMRKAEDDHVVINNLEVDKDYTEDDGEYFKLIGLARNWIQDYALQMNVDPQGLRSLANLEFKPYSMASRIKGLGRNALRAVNEFTRPARDVATKATTVKKEDKARRPRVAALAVLAACVPVSPGILATDLGSDAITFIKQATKSAPGFDSHHYQLPSSSAIPVGALNHKVAYDPQLPNVIYDGASYASGNAAVGHIRKIDPSSVEYDSNQDYGLPGKGASNNCNVLPMKMPGVKSVRIVSTNPAISDHLTASVTNRSLYICNTSHHIMHEGNTHIFIQPEK